MTATVKFKFIGETKGLQKVLGNVNGALGSLIPSARSVAIGFAGMSVAVGAFGKASVSAYSEALQAQTKLSTNLLNVKGNTDANVKSIQKLAGALQKKGVIEDDAIIAGASQLATFGLQGKTIEKLTPKIADMAAQMKGTNATSEDMVKVNNLVGKVMTGNVGALSRYGVTLSETQKKMLKNGNEAERASLLVEVLGQNFGKVNEALAKTPEGQLVILKNRFGELKESVGEMLVKALVPIAGFLLNHVVPAFESLWNAAALLITGDFKGGIFGLSEDAPFIIALFNFRDVLKEVWEWISTKLWPAFIDFLPTLIEFGKTVADKVVAAIQLVGTIIEWATPYITKFAAAFKKAWPSIQTFMKDAWENVLKPIFNSIVKVVKLVVKIFKDSWPAISVVLKAAGIVIGVVLIGIYWTIKNVLVPVLGFLVDNMSRTWGAITNIIEFAWGYIKPIWDLLWAYITNVMIPVWKVLWDAVKYVWDKVSAKIQEVWELVKPILEDLWKFIQDKVVPVLKSIWDGIKENWENVSGVFQEVYNAIVKFWDDLKAKADSLPQWMKDMFGIGKTEITLEGKGYAYSGPTQQRGRGPRALGGPVEAGMSYKVGEGGGPEWFIPSTDGTIVNARQTRGMGSTYNVTMNVSKTDMTQRDLISALKRFESLHAA